MATQNVVNDIYVPLAGGTMTGALILNADPTNALGAVTKQYADAIAAGLDIKTPCYAGTTTSLNATYLNGVSGVGATLTNAGALAAFSVDGVSPPINSRILVKNQASTFQGGIYVLTTVGSGAIAWILTRATDYDEAPSEIFAGNFIIVNNGSTLTDTAWIQTATVATIGTDAITFSQFGNAGTVTSVSGTANRITSTGGATPVIDISASYVGQSSITTLGTITTGVWTGTNIALANGGTNATLTASNGGIFYSTATAGAILSGTATANQLLLSGSSGAPAWSTVTHPATTTINQLLYSSSANVLAGLSTANSSVLVTDGSGVPSLGTALPNGVTATTQSAADNSTKVATTAYADNVAAGGGSLVKIATATASGSATIDFAANLTSTYNDYLFVVHNVVPATTTTTFQGLVGTGGGPTYQTTNYAGIAVMSSAATAGTTFAQLTKATDVVNTSTLPLGGTINLFNTNSAANSKTLFASITYNSSGQGNHMPNLTGIVWNAATALTSFRFQFSTGNISTGVFTLYGYVK